MKIDCCKKAKEARRKILEMTYGAKTSHIGSALSCIDILTVLYFGIMKINPKNPSDPERDRFILSKGHAVAALYATLALKGFFPVELLKTYCQNASKLPGHPTKGYLPGIETTTGSLGHGLPMGVGMALALKKDNKKSRVFVLMSDGECDEGSNWEAILFSGHHKLDNLTVIIDYNKFQAFGKTNEVLNLEPLKDKFIDFGWAGKEIDGHNLFELEQSLIKIPLEKNKPTVIIAHTIMGKGFSFAEGKLESHYKSPTKEQYKMAVEELNI